MPNNHHAAVAAAKLGTGGGEVRIGLISDTHYPEAGPLWDCAYDHLRQSDLILHAGDLHVIEVLDWLEERCGVPVLGVRGNGDDGGGGRPLCADNPRLRPRRSSSLRVSASGSCTTRRCRNGRRTVPWKRWSSTSSVARSMSSCTATRTCQPSTSCAGS